MVVSMPRETRRARYPRRGTGGRFAAFVAPAAIMALMSAGAVAPHAPSPVASGISTVAGGVGGPAKATNVAIFPDCHLAFRAGFLYVAHNGVVRTVSLRTGWLTNPVGTGSIAPLGDGGLATRAAVRACGAAFDHSGNLVIADGAGRIRVVAARTGTFYGQAMTARHIYTVAGGGTGGLGDGVPATQATLFGPSDVAVDRVGNLVIDDRDTLRIRVVAGRTGTFYGQAMTTGDIYTIAGTGTQGFSGDGGPATGAELDAPGTPALDAAGNLVFADSGNERARVVAESTGSFYGQAMTTGGIYTVAGTGADGFSGDGGPATSAEFRGPTGVAVDSAGNLVITDTGNNRIRVVAGSTGTFYGKPMTAGDIYTVAGTGIQGFSGDG